MKPKSEKRLLNEKKRILSLLPKGNASHVNTIKAFEAIDKIKRNKNSIYLFELSEYLYDIKDIDFPKLDTFFKKVHSIIRKKAEKSPYFKKNIELVLLNNYKANTGYYFGEDKGIKLYNSVLDHYDPNKKQPKRRKTFNWEGFWSLITTKDGIVTACYLGDTADREYFYEGLRKRKE